MNAPNTGKRPQSQNQNSVHAPTAVNQKAAVGPSQTHSIRYTTADNHHRFMPPRDTGSCGIG